MNPNSLANLRNGKGQGRVPGARNKRTREIEELAKAMLDRPEYKASLMKRLDEGKAPHMETFFSAHLYGLPPKTLKHEGLAPAQLIVTRVDTKAEIKAILGDVDIDAGPDLDDDE